MAQTIASNSPTGTWQHPRLDEIDRRISATTFGEQNIKAVVLNSTLLALSLVVPGVLYSTPILSSVLRALDPVAHYCLYSVPVLFVINIVVAVLPLLRRKDNLLDIPLTPTQRALLGLKPASAPATPGSQYITPPKYAKSSTPVSNGTSMSSASLSASSRGGTPYSPSASPLFQKAVTREPVRRLSYGSPSPLGLSRSFNDSTNSLSLNNTPSPPMGRGASVGLSSRWLYERGRRTSQPRSLYS